MALLQINNRLGWKDKFKAVFGQVLSLTGIANVKTYYSALQELVDGSYITWKKGPNQFQAASFTIFPLYQNLEEHTEEQGNSTGKADGRALSEQGNSTGNIHKTNKPNKTSKLKKSKTSVRTFVPPTLDEVINFFIEKECTEKLAKKVFEYYAIADWKDSKGNAVKNWKQKMLSVWIKKEKDSAEKENFPNHFDRQLFDKLFNSTPQSHGPYIIHLKQLGFEWENDFFGNPKTMVPKNQSKKGTTAILKAFGDNVRMLPNGIVDHSNNKANR